MKRVRAVTIALLVCLLLLSGIPIAATDSHDGAMSIKSDENTSEYLGPQPEAVDRTGEGTATIDVAGAVEANAGDVRATYRQVSLERQFRNADTDEERRAVIRSGTERLTERVDTLERRHDTAVEAYSSGDIDERELFRTLSAVDREARTTASTAEWLERQARDLDMDAEAIQLSKQRIRLLPLRGPVRSTLDEGISGTDAVRTHVEVSDGGLVLATIERDGADVRYVREAYDSSIRSVDSPDRYNRSPNAALDRIEELYPWVFNNSGPLFAGYIGTNDARIYSFDITHDHGELETYLDGGGNHIVREIQTKNPELVPTTIENSSDTEAVRLRVATTRAGGPLGVTVVDDSGIPLDADVTVNGDPVGSTGEDRLWTVAPRGEVTVTATHGGVTVTVETTLE